MTRALVSIVVLAGCAFASSLETVKAEPDHEKRARAALEYANTAITESRKTYLESDYKRALEILEEVRAAADLCLSSLNATGKNARRSPKPFKRAEQQINELIRRLKSLEGDFGVDDRPHVQSVEQRLQDIHDELVTRIMGKKK